MITIYVGSYESSISIGFQLASAGLRRSRSRSSSRPWRRLCRKVWLQQPLSLQLQRLGPSRRGLRDLSKLFRGENAQYQCSITLEPKQYHRVTPFQSLIGPAARSRIGLRGRMREAASPCGIEARRKRSISRPEAGIGTASSCSGSALCSAWATSRSWRSGSGRHACARIDMSSEIH